MSAPAFSALIWDVFQPPPGSCVALGIFCGDRRSILGPPEDLLVAFAGRVRQPPPRIEFVGTEPIRRAGRASYYQIASRAQVFHTGSILEIGDPRLGICLNTLDLFCDQSLLVHLEWRPATFGLQDIPSGSATLPTPRPVLNPPGARRLLL